MAKKPKNEMTHEEFCAALEKLELTVVGSAPYIGISRRQAQRISSGDSPVPKPVARLLRLVIKHRVDLKELVGE